MRKVLSLGAIAMMASLATAGGELVKVDVGPKPVIRQVSAKSASAYSTIPASHSHALLCNLRRSERIDKMLNEIVNQELSQVRGINKQDVAVSLIEICPDDGGPAAIGHVHGEEMLYASGLARLPYAAALYQAKGGSVSSGLKSDLMASLREGNVEASNGLINHLRSSKGTEYANWYLSSLGLRDFNVNQRFVTGDPEGRDARSLGRKLEINYENSNRLTANQVAGLFYLLASDALVSPGASQSMKAYMHHPLEQRKIGPLAGIAKGLPVGSEIVALNGYTVRNYHDAALIKLPNGKQYVLVVMTKYNGYPTPFVQLLSRTIAFRMMTSTGSEDPALHTYIPRLAR